MGSRRIELHGLFALWRHSRSRSGQRTADARGIAAGGRLRASSSTTPRAPPPRPPCSRSTTRAPAAGCSRRIWAAGRVGLRLPPRGGRRRRTVAISRPPKMARRSKAGPSSSCAGRPVTACGNATTRFTCWAPAPVLDLRCRRARSMESTSRSALILRASRPTDWMAATSIPATSTGLADVLKTALDNSDQHHCLSAGARQQAGRRRRFRRSAIPDLARHAQLLRQHATARNRRRAFLGGERGRVLHDEYARPRRRSRVLGTRPQSLAGAQSAR